MGYYTDYKLKVIKNSTDSELTESFYDNLVTELERISGEHLYLDYSKYYGGYHIRVDSTKWYSHSQHLIEFSVKYPDLTFELNGDGEEKDDLWNAFIKNGNYKMFPAKVTIEYQEYDENVFNDL